MPEASYRGRRAVTIENSHLRVTVLCEGGHIAEIFDQHSGVNPLWTPPWPSLEPSTYDVHRHPEYGGNTESKLLAGLMGHNLCLDLFGGPSPEEAEAGVTVHGEGSVALYEIAESGTSLTMQTEMPRARLHFSRTLDLVNRAVRIRETVENLSASDHPLAWTEHVTLGSPFLEPGVTEFRASATRSKVFEKPFGAGEYLKTAAEFDWPMAPKLSGGTADLRVLNSAPVSSGFTTHLMDPHQPWAYFTAFAPMYHLVFAYLWQQSDFPWLGIWEENHSRTSPPWNGETLARGMEFGVSPIPESRREMIDRGRLFGVPTYRWLPAKGKLQVEYWVVLETADAIPESLGPESLPVT